MKEIKLKPFNNGINGIFKKGKVRIIYFIYNLSRFSLVNNIIAINARMINIGMIFKMLKSIYFFSSNLKLHPKHLSSYKYSLLKKHVLLPQI